MVPRVACVEGSIAESPRFPENPGQGASLPWSHTTDAFANTVEYPQERTTAKSLFTTADGVPNALAEKTAATVSTAASRAAVTTDEPKAAATAGKAGRLMSKEEQARVKEAIAKATSVEEIRKLERQLKEGFLPDMESVGA